MSDMFCNQSKYEEITGLRAFYWVPTMSCNKSTLLAVMGDMFLFVHCRENSTGAPKNTQVRHMFCYDPELNFDGISTWSASS